MVFQTAFITIMHDDPDYGNCFFKRGVHCFMISKTHGTCKLKLFVLFAGVMLLLLLTGCANIGTEITLDGSSFSGSRVMSVTFDVDELNTKLPGGIADLDSLDLQARGQGQRGCLRLHALV